MIKGKSIKRDNKLPATNILNVRIYEERKKMQEHENRYKSKEEQQQQQERKEKKQQMKQDQYQRLNVYSGQKQQYQQYQQYEQDSEANEEQMQYYLMEIERTVKNIDNYEQRINQEKKKRQLLNQLLQCETNTELKQPKMEMEIRNKSKRESIQPDINKDMLQNESEVSLQSSSWIAQQFKQIQNFMEKYEEQQKNIANQQQKPPHQNTMKFEHNYVIDMKRTKAIIPNYIWVERERPIFYGQHSKRRKQQAEVNNMESGRFSSMGKTRRRSKKIFNNSLRQSKDFFAQQLKEEDKKMREDFKKQKDLQDRKIHEKTYFDQQYARICEKFKKFSQKQSKQNSNILSNRVHVNKIVSFDDFNGKFNEDQENLYIIPPSEKKHNICLQIFKKETRKYDNFLNKTVREEKKCIGLLSEMRYQRNYLKRGKHLFI